MDEKRMAVLKAKAAKVGLSEREACELGRLYAEAEGKPYSDVAAEREIRAAEDRAERERRAQRRRKGPIRLLLGTRRLEIGTTSVPAEEAEHEEYGPRSDREKRKAA